MLKEFKEFALKGNVLDLAIGVIIGGAFGAIIKSMVGDILMPIVGAIFGGLDFNNYFAGLSEAVNAATLEAAREQGAVLAYGSFITAAINFLIIAFILFMIVKAINKMQKAEEEAPAAPAAPPANEVLLAEIRDLLKKK
ncbi:MAG: large conductance mechanosensitive channel protein MscL [Hyphomicrobiales bacterium]|nr:large conductance mechanosensitive channel protein MscL [Hyphomicrobiales bacterium]